MCVFDFSMSEPTQPQLHHRSIVQNLSWRIGMRNAVLKMGHEHQISCLKPIVVNSMMVNVTKNCSGTQSVCGIFCVDIFAEFVHLLKRSFLICALPLNNLRKNLFNLIWCWINTIYYLKVSSDNVNVSCFHRLTTQPRNCRIYCRVHHGK